MFTVYTYRDELGFVLYVGMTGRGLSRSHKHAKTKDWWPFVHKATFVHCATEREARAVERRTIEQLRPYFNVQHTSSWHRQFAVAEYMALRDLAEYVAQGDTEPSSA